MKAGVGMALMNVRERPDNELYRSGLRLADLAEPWGFDSIWTVEHHFSGHCPVPNALQVLSYLAGRTSRVLLGTGVIVLPWHDPIRVAEEIAVLDVLSGGRVLVGLGRGYGALEFDGFRIPMSEARDRFVEAVEIIVKGLSLDEFEFAGRFYQVPPISIRPRPVSRPERRLYGAATSPESASIMAKLGIGLLISPQRLLAPTVQQVNRYREDASEAGYQPLPPITHMYVSVARTRDEAMERARNYMTPMFQSLDDHYQFSTGRLKGVAGYEHHASSIKPYAFDRDVVYQQSAIDAFIDKHLIGTPEECLERLSALRTEVGLDHFVGEFMYGGMPDEESMDNMRLFADAVLPTLHDPLSFGVPG